MKTQKFTKSTKSNFNISCVAIICILALTLVAGFLV